ncbi:hypothetical protein [Actinocatenispora comari]|jgi:hypothetical protein|uniref:Uncharacterized protein n=1 Tax=Actinocatenispora comari TaxID=2807577 RepID=A0A8J4ER64_9ACTN|nr:hypothetical protein [Actinocatenispora comari]GIL30534.1 hypothetical protein NUM_57880 [Actinocatenispora comari]
MGFDDGIPRIRRRPEWSVFIISARFAILGVAVAATGMTAILLGCQGKFFVYLMGFGAFVAVISIISFGTVVVAVINPVMNSVDIVRNLSDMSVQADFFSALIEDVSSLRRWKSFDPHSGRN